MAEDSKRAKMEVSGETVAVEPLTCRHFVKRKKRYCRLTPAKGSEFCGEHLPVTNISSEAVDTNDTLKKRIIRVSCPLDPKHSVFPWKLKKHLKTCNALVKDQPDYIVAGLNSGKDDTDYSENQMDFKLADVNKETVDEIIEKINKLHALYEIEEKIDELTANHPLLCSEINNEEYGHETIRQLIQTSTILGYLNHLNLFGDHISYVEYGAGKGQVSYWLAKAIAHYPNSNVLLIDRASMRHKKDNKLDESHAVQRIRADIADFDLSKHELIQKSNGIVGIGKHLCGAATDFAIQCSINGNRAAAETGNGPNTMALIIALCCHHRCEWKHFVGKDFFIENEVSPREFAIITKMVGWAICGTGMSRERRKQMDEQKFSEITERRNQSDDDQNFTKRDQHQRKEIGQKCKRLIDFARICYMEKNGFKCSLKRYVNSDITLENICLVAIYENNK